MAGRLRNLLCVARRAGRRNERDDEGSVRVVMMIEIVGRTNLTVIKRPRDIPELCALHITNDSWDLKRASC